MIAASVAESIGIIDDHLLTRHHAFQYLDLGETDETWLHPPPFDPTAVHDEHVAIGAGGQRSKCCLPYAFGILRQLRRGHAAAADAGDVAGTSKFDVLCVRREDAEGDAAIGTDLG